MLIVWIIFIFSGACIFFGAGQSLSGALEDNLQMSLACPGPTDCGEHLLNCEPHGVVSIKGAIHGYKAPDFQPYCISRDLCMTNQDPCCKYSNSSDCLQVVPKSDLDLLHSTCEGKGHCLFRSQYSHPLLCEVIEGYVPFSAIAYTCVNRSLLLNPVEERSLVGQEVHIFYPGRQVTKPLTESSSHSTQQSRGTHPVNTGSGATVTATTTPKSLLFQMPSSSAAASKLIKLEPLIEKSISESAYDSKDSANLKDVQYEKDYDNLKDVQYHTDSDNLKDVEFHEENNLKDVEYHKDRDDLKDGEYHKESGNLKDAQYHKDGDDLKDLEYHTHGDNLKDADYRKDSDLKDVDYHKDSHNHKGAQYHRDNDNLKPFEPLMDVDGYRHDFASSTPTITGGGLDDAIETQHSTTDSSDTFRSVKSAQFDYRKNGTRTVSLDTFGSKKRVSPDYRKVTRKVSSDNFGSDMRALPFDYRNKGTRKGPFKFDEAGDETMATLQNEESLHDMTGAEETSQNTNKTTTPTETIKNTNGRTLNSNEVAPESKQNEQKQYGNLYVHSENESDSEEHAHNGGIVSSIVDMMRRNLQLQMIKEDMEKADEAADLFQAGESYKCKVNSAHAANISAKPEDVWRLGEGAREEIAVSVMYLRMVGTPRGCTKVSVVDRSRRVTFRCTDDTVSKHEGRQLKTMVAPLDVYIRLGASLWEDDFVWLKFASLSGSPLTLACQVNNLPSDSNSEDSEVDWYVVFSGLAVTGALFALFFVAALAYIVYRRRKWAGTRQNYNLERTRKAKKRSASLGEPSTYSPQQTEPKVCRAPPMIHSSPPSVRQSWANRQMSPLTMHMKKLQAAQEEEDDVEKQEQQQQQQQTTPTFRRTGSYVQSDIATNNNNTTTPILKRTNQPLQVQLNSPTSTSKRVQISTASTYPIMSFLVSPPRSPFPTRSPKPARVAPPPPVASPRIPVLPLLPPLPDVTSGANRRSPPFLIAPKRRTACRRGTGETSPRSMNGRGESPKTASRGKKEVPVPPQRTAFVTFSPVIPKFGRFSKTPEPQTPSPKTRSNKNPNIVNDDNDAEDEQDNGPFTIYANYPLVTDLDEDNLDLDSGSEMTYSNAQTPSQCTTEEDGVSLNSTSLDFDCLEKIDRGDGGESDVDENEEEEEEKRYAPYSRCGSHNVRRSKDSEV